MPTDTIVTVQDTAVMYVAGETGKPIAEQAPKAFKELESKLASLKGRKFYGVVLRRRLPNWEDNLHLIGPTFETLCRRSDFDRSRPRIEYYRSQRELLVMVPVQ